MSGEPQRAPDVIPYATVLPGTPAPPAIPAGLLERWQRLEPRHCRHVLARGASWWELGVHGSTYRLSLLEPAGWDLLANAVRERARELGWYFCVQWVPGGGHRAILAHDWRPDHDRFMGLHQLEGAALLEAYLDANGA